jgi:hypothetical protein
MARVLIWSPSCQKLAFKSLARYSAPPKLANNGARALRHIVAPRQHIGELPRQPETLADGTRDGFRTRRSEVEGVIEWRLAMASRA